MAGVPARRPGHQILAAVGESAPALVATAAGAPAAAERPAVAIVTTAALALPIARPAAVRGDGASLPATRPLPACQCRSRHLLPS